MLDYKRDILSVSKDEAVIRDTLNQMEGSREQQVLEQALAILTREWSPERIYLFGSRAKGEASPTADFDLALEGPIPPPEIKQKMKKLVEAAAGLYSVDIVFLDEVDNNFRQLILATGKVIYESQRGSLRI